MQYSLDGLPADPSLMRREEGSAIRTYRFRRRASVANLVDQLALVSGRSKSEIVADSIRLAALYVNLAGPEALETVAKCDCIDDLISAIKDSI